jgi:hypothetical protein
LDWLSQPPGRVAQKTLPANPQPLATLGDAAARIATVNPSAPTDKAVILANAKPDAMELENRKIQHITVNNSGGAEP